MSIFDKYDLVDIDEPIHIPVKPELGLTVIVGASGTGKTTILKAWGMVAEDLDQNTPIIDLFISEDIGEKYLIKSGLRTVPAWRRSLSEVSNGERHRAEIAVLLSKGSVFIDEFTSLVDRTTARALCNSMSGDLILATCHRDVLSWLDADNIYDADSCQWLDRGSLRRESEFNVSISPCDPEEIWSIFKKHHYLSGKINKACNSWVAIHKGKPVGMVSVLSFPSGNWKNGWREHRTVVLPEFQGMGIGSAISNAVADHIVSTGARYFSKTSHPALGEHRNKSDKWKATSKNGVKRKDYTLSRSTKEDGHKMQHAHRVCYSHEYIIDKG